MIADTTPFARTVLLGAVLLWLAPTRHDESCDLERTWYAGDVHFNERFDFRRDSTGTWVASGMAGDAPQARIDFRWEADSSSVTVTYGTDQRTSRVAITVARRNDYCTLKFDTHPFAREGGGFTYFADFP